MPDIYLGRATEDVALMSWLLSGITRIHGSVDDDFPPSFEVEIALCHLKSILGETKV